MGMSSRRVYKSDAAHLVITHLVVPILISYLLSSRSHSMGRRPLMGGNWKLNPRKVSDAVGLATEVRYLLRLLHCIYYMLLFTIGSHNTIRDGFIWDDRKEVREKERRRGVENRAEKMRRKEGLGKSRVRVRFL